MSSTLTVIWWDVDIYFWVCLLLKNPRRCLNTTSSRPGHTVESWNHNLHLQLVIKSFGVVVHVATCFTYWAFIYSVSGHLSPLVIILLCMEEHTDQLKGSMVWSTDLWAQTAAAGVWSPAPSPPALVAGWPDTPSPSPAAAPAAWRQTGQRKHNSSVYLRHCHKNIRWHQGTKVCAMTNTTWIKWVFLWKECEVIFIYYL